MARLKQYKRTAGLFKLPSKKPAAPEGSTVKQEAICLECRHPLNWSQRRYGAKYCSHACANKANGRKNRGKKRTVFYRSNCY